MNQLTDKEQGLLAFALFTTAMRIGPDVFPTMESIAEKIGITDKYVHYAGDWLHYSRTVKESALRAEMFEEPKPDPDQFAKPEYDQKFTTWLVELRRVTAAKTGLQSSTIGINEAEARRFFNDGFTPYQCFRETWNMENDAGV